LSLFAIVIIIILVVVVVVVVILVVIIFIIFQGRMCSLVEVLQQAAVLVLQILAQLHGLMQELSNLLKVGLLETPGCHGRGPNAHPTRGHG